jgi:hypothetical protein
MSCDYLLGCDNLSREQLRKHNVTELQSILAQLNLPSSGKKHELVDRFYQFWLQLQKPGSSGNAPPQVSVIPTSCVQFSLPSAADSHSLRAELEAFGHISGFLIDPRDSSASVAYRNHESAQKLFAASGNLALADVRFIMEGDIEKRSRELGLLPEHLQLRNAVQKSFRRTATEPRIYWRPAPQSQGASA